MGKEAKCPKCGAPLTISDVDEEAGVVHINPGCDCPEAVALIRSWFEALW